MKFTILNYMKNSIVGIMLLLIMGAGAQNDIPRVHEQLTFGSQNETDLSSFIGGPDPIPTFIESGIGATNTATTNPETYVLLGIDNDRAPFENYTFQLVLNITPVLSDGQLDAPNAYEKTLSVNFKPESNSGNGLDQVYHRIENSYGAKLEVVGYTKTTEAGSSAEVPDNVELRVGFKAIRVFDLNGQPAPSPNIVYNNLTNEYEVNWQSVSGALSYDVEWSWVDTYGNEFATMTIETFEKNSTRINTKNTSYNITNIYDLGKLFYRVRAVGRFIDDYNTNYHGPWSNQSNPLDEILINPHDEDKNWQFQASYAEEGKKKEVISYFDGTLRNRQTVTKINSDDNAIVGEVIYDNQGRPAIEVLPVPAGDNKLQYYSNFNRNMAGKKYSHLDFDWDVPSTNVNICDINVSGMSTIQGASRYYSSENASTSEFKDFIPDAEFYPFSQIEYTADNTGRIKRKSGVGTTHRLGTDKEMKYFYSKPYQEELDRLFGYNVGYDVHYKKNAVIDPNGQASISYIDPQGRTIATALVSDNPTDGNGDVLLGLDDENNDALHLTTQLDLMSIGANDLYNTGEFVGFSMDDAYRFNANKTVLKSGLHTFNYDLKIEGAFTNDCLANNPIFENKGYPFVFDLTLNATNDCGNPLSSNLPIEDKLVDETQFNPLNYTSPDDVSLIDLNSVSNTDVDFSVTPPIGDMGVYKLLKVDKAVLDLFTEDYIRRAKAAGCILEASVFDANASISGCFTTCQECVDAIAIDQTDYVTTQMAEYAFLDLDQETQDALNDRFIREYELLVDACMINCETDGINTTEEDAADSISCNVMTMTLVNDMKLLGQYGLYVSSEDEANQDELEEFPLVPVETSIFSDANVLASPFVLDLISTAYPTTTTVSWKTPFHPDYQTADPAHYYDLAGNIIKIAIPITYNDNLGVFESIYPVMDNLVLEEDSLNPGFANIEPQQLQNFEHYKLFWNDTWAESLVTFHPEYSYVHIAKQLCTMTNQITTTLPIDNGAGTTTGTFYVNIDGYANYLESLSYADAVAAGYLTEGNQSIVTQDPFLGNAIASEFVNVPMTSLMHKTVMVNAMSNYEGSNKTMLYMSFMPLACNSIGACNNIVYNPNGLSTEDKEHFWDIYRSTYLSFRDRIKSVVANTYAIGEGTYNACIGSTTNAGDPILGLNTYGWPATNGAQSGNDICGINAALFFDKEKRIVSEDYNYDSNQSSTQTGQDLEALTDYQFYVQSGQCPMGRDFEAFVKGITEDTNNSGTSNFGDFGSFQGNYLSMDLFEDLGGLPTYDDTDGDGELEIVNPNTGIAINGTAGTTSDQWKVTIDVANPNMTLDPIQFNLPSNSAYAWSSYNSTWVIREIKNFDYTTYDVTTNPIVFSFEMVAKIGAPNSNVILEEIVISGTTTARIGECSIEGQDDVAVDGNGDTIGEELGTGGPLNDEDCEDKTNFRLGLKNVLNALNDANQLTNNGVALSTVAGTAYTESNLPQLFGDLSNAAIWDFNGDHPTIKVNGNVVFDLNFDDQNFVQVLLGLGGGVNYFDAVTFGNTEGILKIAIATSQGIDVNESTITILDYDCCSYITGNDCGDIDTDGDGIPDLCDDTPCGEVDTDGDGIYDFCDSNDDCHLLTCDTAFIGVLNYLNGNNNLLSNLFTLSEQPSFEGSCLQAFYQIDSGDTLVWTSISGTHFLLKRNGITIVDFFANVDVSAINVQTFDSITFDQNDSPTNLRYYGAIGYTTVTGASNSFDYSRSIFQCDFNNLCNNPNGFDYDQDGVDDGCDNCLNFSNPNQEDQDGDGIGDKCDNCVSLSNPNQEDLNSNDIGDACDTDSTGCLFPIQELQTTFLPNMKSAFNTVLNENVPFNSYVTISNAQIDNWVQENNLLNRFQVAYNNGFGESFSNFVDVRCHKSTLFQDSMHIKWSIVPGANPAKTCGVTLYPIPDLDNLTEIQNLEFLDNNNVVKITGLYEDGSTQEFDAAIQVTMKRHGSTILNGFCNFLKANPLSTKSISGIQTSIRNRDFEAQNAEDEVCVMCIPQTISPVAWSQTAYQTSFEAYMNGVEGYAIPEYYDHEYFSDMNYQYILDGYLYYLETFGANTTGGINAASSYFMIISEFGATALNYGYNDYAAVVDAYYDYAWIASESRFLLSDETGYRTWSEFVNSYLSENPQICPPRPMFPVINIPDNDTQTNCEEFSQSISEAYGADNYEAYIERLKKEFKMAYTQAALASVTETFKVTYSDKEYQYTLYYYDQAGNLTQTVPPQGVKRTEFANLDNTGLAQDRANNPDGTLALPVTALPAHELKTEYKYNSLNQLVWQSTLDGGITRFAYDKLGRIIASQNAKQLADVDFNKMSYTKYDGLGRITEAGEIANSTDWAAAGGTYLINDHGQLQHRFNGSSGQETVVVDGFDAYLSKGEVTKTHYDDRILVEDGLYSNQLFTAGYTEFNSINRVTAVLYFDAIQANQTPQFDNGLFYNYDVHGNVKELVTYITDLKVANCVETSSNNILDCEVHIKRVHYDYDLISGNVNQVTFQPNKADQFMHRYEYDADNRIVNAKTSKDGYIWEEDANYEYYEHGPLARTELGDKKVQGVDYAYTLQGWLKTVNGESLTSTQNDMGHDGEGTHANVAKDAYGYSLNYYDNDYSSIGGINNQILKLTNPTNVLTSNDRNLYNGNIKRMVTTLRDKDEQMLSTQANNYVYDQLNRISSMNSQAVVDNSGNASLTTTDSYASSYEYDRNGNLKVLKREVPNEGALFNIDNFEYHYDDEKKNRLLTVQDHTSQTIFDSDLKDQLNQLGVPNFIQSDASTHNYVYDEIGQLIEDKTEGLNISWRVDGKVKEIHKTLGSENKTIRFSYDGLGNRLGKEVINDGDTNTLKTVYARDAQGNVMGVYDKIGTVDAGNILTLDDDLVLESDVITNDQGTLIAQNTITVAGGANNYTVNAPDGELNLVAGNTIRLLPGFVANSGSVFTAVIGEGPQSDIASFKLKEHHIYGSSRLGVQESNITLLSSVTSNTTEEEDLFKNVIGDKRYELSNHLGNVLSVISDSKLVDVNNNIVTFKSNVLAYNDYYPFGMLLPNRNGSSDSYRYGFNGKEKDDEVKGEGLQYDYGFRIYDPRIAKFLSEDPLTKEYPWYTPYQFAGNTPIQANDLDGLEEIHYSLVYDRNNGTTTLKYSHSVDIIDRFNDLVIDREATQWMDPGEYHYEERVEINKRTRYVLDIYDPSYGEGRENRTDTYATKVKRTKDRFKGKSSISSAGSGYAEAYTFDVYDYAAATSGKSELSNAEKDQVDFDTFMLMLEAVPVGRILGKLRFIAHVKVLTKGERIVLFSKMLENSPGAKTVDEAMKLVNSTLDKVEDMYSGVKKNPNAAKMPNRDDGRMYGILDDTYVTRKADGSAVARTKGNIIEFGSEGSIKILTKDKSKVLLDKPGG